MRAQILKPAVLLLLLLFAGQALAFPLWLKSPKRENPHDPQSPNFVVPAPTPVINRDPRDPMDDVLAGANPGSPVLGTPYSQTGAWIGGGSDSMDHYLMTLTPGMNYEIQVTVTGGSGVINLNVDSGAATNMGSAGANVLNYTAVSGTMPILVSSFGNLSYNITVTQLVAPASATPTFTPVASATPTYTPLPTSTQTPLPTMSFTPSAVFSTTNTLVPTMTFTPPPTQTFSMTHTFTPMFTATDSPTPSSYPPGWLDGNEDGDLTLAIHEGRDGNWYGIGDGAAAPVPLLFTDSPGSTGQAIRFTAGATTPGSWYAAGFNFINGAAPYDASAWNGIEVWLRAEGATQTSVTLQVGDGVNDALAPLTITNIWVRYEIPFAANPLLNTSGLTLFQINVAGGMAVDLWIDDASLITTAMAPTATPTSVVYPSGLIDDLEDGNTQVALNEGRDGYWYGYDDGSAVPVWAGLAQGPGETSTNAYHYTLGGTTPPSVFGGGFGLNFRDLAAPYDASAWDGLQLSMRAETGTQMSFNLSLSDGTNTAVKPLTITDTWAVYDLSFALNGSMNTAALVQMQIDFAAGIPADVWVDNVRFAIGVVAPTSTPTPMPACWTDPGTPAVTSDPWHVDSMAATGQQVWIKAAPPDFVALGTAAPRTGTNHMHFYLDMVDWWNGGGWNWAGWFAPVYDMVNYDTFEFWIRGAAGGEDCGFTFGFTAATGTTAQLPLATYLSGPLTTTYQKVVVPLCDFDFSGVDTTTVQQLDFAAGGGGPGVICEFYIDDGYFVKY